MYTANVIISDPNGSEVRRVTLKNNIKLLYLWEVTFLSDELLLAPHGAQAVIAFRYYPTLLLLLYFPNILLKPLKTNH